MGNLFPLNIYELLTHQETVKDLIGEKMSQDRSIETSLSFMLWCIVFAIILFGIKNELHSIADSLEILSSPPQTVELQHKSAKVE